MVITCIISDHANELLYNCSKYKNKKFCKKEISFKSLKIRAFLSYILWLFFFFADGDIIDHNVYRDIVKKKAGTIFGHFRKITKSGY